MSEDTLLLKWGTIKGWNFSDKKSLRLLKKYIALGAFMSCAMQDDTPEQKKIICELIRNHKGTITNDWDGKDYTQKQAIEYVMNYGKERKRA